MWSTLVLEVDWMEKGNVDPLGSYANHFLKIESYADCYTKP